MFSFRNARGMRESIAAFRHNTSGGFVIQLAIMFIPLALIAGGSMDYVRQQNAQSIAQSAADSAALAAAVAVTSRNDNYEGIAREAAELNLRDTLADSGHVASFTFDPETMESRIVIEGRVPTTFLNLITIGSLPFTATSTAIGAMEGSTEVALVLDNTWSMSVMTSMGVSRINALKGAASRLVTTLMQNPDADVSIGLVPYVDYVNVGMANRNQPWIDVPADYTEVIPPSGSCTTVTTQQQCRNVGPPKTCERVRDGVVEYYTCYDRECETVQIPPQTTCPTATTRHYRWHGCVVSRLGGLHVTDASPQQRYVGIMETGSPSVYCRNPIVPLTNTAATLQTAITNMNIGTGNRPMDTYIPGGLIWGLNLLSPELPFDEAKDYDEKNENPRKAMVIMTDGANTLRFNNGHHSTGGTVAQRNQTYTDMVEICTLAKSRGIEVYSVAFEVTDTQPLQALQNCATSSNHYFDASNAEALYAAFDQIARSLMTVRLVR